MFQAEGSVRYVARGSYSARSCILASKRQRQSCDAFVARFIADIYAAVAEEEARAISVRTKAALAAAKARGVKLGGPKLAQARLKGHAANRRNADKFAAKIKPIIAEIRASGVTSLRKVATALQARGVATARGGQWTVAQVSNALRR